MAKRPRLSKALANAAADAVTARLAGGWLRLYDGIQPTSADAPVATQALLAVLKLGRPAFKPAIDGSAEATPIAPDDSAVGGGTATWFRVEALDGASGFDGSVGMSDADLILGATLIQPGTIVRVTEFRYTQRRQ